MSSSHALLMTVNNPLFSYMVFILLIEAETFDPDYSASHIVKLSIPVVYLPFDLKCHITLIKKCVECKQTLIMCMLLCYIEMHNDK